jgi:hypothetical protein
MEDIPDGEISIPANASSMIEGRLIAPAETLAALAARGTDEIGKMRP